MTIQRGKTVKLEQFVTTSGYTPTKISYVDKPQGSNRELRPGVWVHVQELDRDLVVAIAGREQTQKKSYATILTDAKRAEWFVARLSFLAIRGDEVGVFLFQVQSPLI